MDSRNKWDGKNKLAAFVGILAILLFAAFVFWLPTTEPAEKLRTEKDFVNDYLAEDIVLLSGMIGVELKSYPLPTILVLAEDGFKARVNEKVAQGKLPPDDYIGFHSCGQSDEIVFSEQYKKAALEFGMDPQKYFWMIRYHELYHWATCKTEGEYRFLLDGDPNKLPILALWQREERRAVMLERRYLIEKLGVVLPTKQDFVAPPPPWHPSVRSKFPDDSLLKVFLYWRKAVEGISLADTEDGTPIFVYIFKAKHIDGEDEYFYNLLSHRGEYVEISVFKNGVFYRGWSDKGYAGNPLSEKLPAHPVYVNEWVRIK
jgi:hypothetical protein